MASVTAAAFGPGDDQARPHNNERHAMNIQPSSSLARKAASFGLAIGLTLAAVASQAAVARFETTSFSYSVSGGQLSWGDYGQFQALTTDTIAGGGLLGAENDSNYQDAFTGASLTSSTVYASTTVGASSAMTVQGTAQATRTSLPLADFPGIHEARGTSNQYGEFSLSGDGNVTFTVGWLLQVEGAAADPFSDMASALMTFMAGNYDSYYDVSFSEEIFSFDSASGLATASGTWTATVALAAGELGWYDLRGTSHATADSAYVSNDVPEPGSLALLTVGLGTLWGVRRRRSARKA
jgi:hypothetical protein